MTMRTYTNHTKNKGQLKEKAYLFSGRRLGSGNWSGAYFFTLSLYLFSSIRYATRRLRPHTKKSKNKISFFTNRSSLSKKIKFLVLATSYFFLQRQYTFWIFCFGKLAKILKSFFSWVPSQLKPLAEYHRLNGVRRRLTSSQDLVRIFQSGANEKVDKVYRTCKV